MHTHAQRSWHSVIWVEERLNTLGEEVNVTARFTDLDEMIQQTQPDIVAIPTGTEFHYDLCMRVLEHGGPH